MEMEVENSNRRRFVRKLVDVTALAGVAGVMMTHSTSRAYADDGSGLIIGQENSGTLSTTLTASPGGSAAFQVTNQSSEGSSKAIYGYASASTGSTYGVQGLSASEKSEQLATEVSELRNQNQQISDEVSKLKLKRPTYDQLEDFLASDLRRAYRIKVEKKQCD